MTKPDEMSHEDLLADLVGYVAGRENLGYHPEAWDTYTNLWLQTPRGKETLARMKDSGVREMELPARLLTDGLIAIGLVQHGPERIDKPGAPIASAAPISWGQALYDWLLKQVKE
jgi:hypothetical protein